MLYGPNGDVIASAPTSTDRVVELLSLDKRGDLWFVLAAVDGRKLSQAFCEPAGNVEQFTREDDLLAYLKEQAISFADWDFSQPGRA